MEDRQLREVLKNLIGPMRSSLHDQATGDLAILRCNQDTPVEATLVVYIEGYRYNPNFKVTCKSGVNSRT
uniref:Uncharacterized protein n=1 Tax=Hyaloperonospora arabidopsidis (strain Emoy2) TaxID=559515 RepID=M4BDF0_HYAAE